MDTPGSPDEGESDEVRELRSMADTVREALVDASSMAASGMRRLVGPDIAHAFGRLAASATRSVGSMQPRLQYDPDDPGPGLAESCRGRGVETVLLTRPATLSGNPLLSSLYPTGRVGPVFLRAVLLDEAGVLVEGVDTADGEPTAWLTERTDLVVPVLELWRRSLVLSVPVLEPGSAPPLSRRQVHVARLLATGEKDQVIARRLDMSERTVERDVRAILAELGARSRAEAVLTMTGRRRGGR